MFTYLQIAPPRRFARLKTVPCAAFGVEYQTLIVAPNRHGALPWRTMVRVAGESPLVVPQGIRPPEGVPVFTGTALRRIWMTRAAVGLLHRHPPAKRQVAVYDRDARYPETVLALAPQVGTLLVVTDRPGGFETVARTVMRRYGAALSFVSCETARTAQLAVAPNGIWANVLRPTVTLSGADCGFGQVFDGYVPPTAYRIDGGTPCLYDALYQLAHVRQLAQVFPTAVCGAGKTLDIERGI